MPDPSEMTDEEYTRWLAEQDYAGSGGGGSGGGGISQGGYPDVYFNYQGDPNLRLVVYKDQWGQVTYQQIERLDPDTGQWQVATTVPVGKGAPKPAAAPGYTGDKLQDLQYAYDSGQITGDRYLAGMDELLAGRQSAGEPSTYDTIAGKLKAYSELTGVPMDEATRQAYINKQLGVPTPTVTAGGGGMTDYQRQQLENAGAKAAQDAAEFEQKQALDLAKFEKDLNDTAFSQGLSAAQFEEQMRQFNENQAQSKAQFAATMQLSRDQMGQQAQQFGMTFNEGVRQFDIGQQNWTQQFGESQRQFDVSGYLAERKFLADVSQNPRNWLQYANMLSGNYTAGDNLGEIAQGINRLVPIAPGLIPATNLSSLYPKAFAGSTQGGGGAPSNPMLDVVLAANPDIRDFYAKQGGWQGKSAGEILSNWARTTGERGWRYDTVKNAVAAPASTPEAAAFLADNPDIYKYYSMTSGDKQWASRTATDILKNWVGMTDERSPERYGKAVAIVGGTAAPVPPGSTAPAPFQGVAPNDAGAGVGNPLAGPAPIGVNETLDETLVGMRRGTGTGEQNPQFFPDGTKNPNYTPPPFPLYPSTLPVGGGGGGIQPTAPAGTLYWPDASRGQERPWMSYAQVSTPVNMNDPAEVARYYQRQPGGATLPSAPPTGAPGAPATGTVGATPADIAAVKAGPNPVIPALPGIPEGPNYAADWPRLAPPSTGTGYTAADIANVRRQLQAAGWGGGSDADAVSAFLGIAGNDQTQQPLVARLKVAAPTGTSAATAAAFLAANPDIRDFYAKQAGWAGRSATDILQNWVGMTKETGGRVGTARKMFQAQPTPTLPQATSGAPGLPGRLQTIQGGGAIAPAGLPKGAITLPGVQAQANMSPVEREMYAGVAEMQGIPYEDWQAQLGRVRSGMGAPGRSIGYGGVGVTPY
mgnify:CR=1 FL=1